ncbi:MAG: alpha/beta hydrolase [Flavobacteriaceae bacterium]|nr:alpha/beta hydrolase [Flavobacteriaceae bacterium]
MKYFKTIYLGLFLTISLLSCKSDDTNNETQNLDASLIYQNLDVSYGENSDQKFDLYLPANRTLNTKYLILVHGGGWTSGDKEDLNDLVNVIQQDFPNLGIVNINYRLADDDNPAFPMQLNDITLIINQLKENQSFYTISDEFGFLGISAGAHLSMLWSYAFDSERKTRMTCSIVGPTNFTDPSYLDSAFNLVFEEYLSVFPNQTTAYLESVSPFHQATPFAPPTILFYGGQDLLIPTSQGIEMSAKLVTLGVNHEFILYRKEGHGWVGASAIDTRLKLNAFIEEYLVN